VWWTRGRDPEIGPVPDFIVTPPAELSPAVVGALVDEHVDQRDIVATLVDLGRRGILQIDPETHGDFRVTLLQDYPDGSPFERALLETFFGSDRRKRRSTRRLRGCGASSMASWYSMASSRRRRHARASSGRRPGS
jgi:hypothetical protein